MATPQPPARGPCGAGGGIRSVRAEQGVLLQRVAREQFTATFGPAVARIIIASPAICGRPFCAIITKIAAGRIRACTGTLRLPSGHATGELHPPLCSSVRACVGSASRPHIPAPSAWTRGAKLVPAPSRSTHSRQHRSFLGVFVTVARPVCCLTAAARCCCVPPHHGHVAASRALSARQAGRNGGGLVGGRGKLACPVVFPSTRAGPHDPMSAYKATVRIPGFKSKVCSHPGCLAPAWLAWLRLKPFNRLVTRHRHLTFFAPTPYRPRQSL